MSDKKILGEIGEKIAQEYLIKKNYLIVELNWRYKKAELYRLAAENYLEVNDLEHEIHFDVISIIHNNNKTEIEHFISVF